MQCFVLLLMLISSALLHAQVERTVSAIVADRDGSTLVIGIEDVNVKGAKRAHLVLAVRPSTGFIVWRYEPPAPPRTISLSPGDEFVAVGLWGQDPAGEGLFLLRSASGQQIAALSEDDKLQVDPGAIYPRWGGGMENIRFSPDGSWLYGLTGDTLFAWDTAARHYLWAREVPAVIVAPPDQPDPLPYGHATGFALSPDGRQIAAIRDVLRVASAGRTRPSHFIKREASGSMQIASAAFSADNKILAAGEFGTLNGEVNFYSTELWVAGALHPVKIEACGNHIAWSANPDIFACQNDTGAHLRNIHDPQKDIGVAGPVSDLPILKVGDSLWSVAYKMTDWKDATKPLPLTLVELGTGRRMTLTLPGR